MVELIEIKKFIKHLASLSQKEILKYFRTEIKIDTKADNSPVTIADKNAEEIIRKEIEKEFPSHGILGEEFGEINKDAEYKWIIDPIDGTQSFICGSVFFGTQIALLKNGSPILGAVNFPALNEFIIGDNNSTQLNDKDVKVRKCDSISDAVLLTGDYLNIEKYQNISVFNKLIKSVKLFRGWGDCYGYYLLASGYADIMVDPIMSPWDSLPLIPIIKGAGGVITDYQGNDAVKGKSIIASNSVIHSEVIKSLNINSVQ
ncbi:MAG: histidinol-phosphatase [Bacteroidetes bacterium]|nr:histidinol-phosphatase [Bacteroidota bacterium]